MRKITNWTAVLTWIGAAIVSGLFWWFLLWIFVEQTRLLWATSERTQTMNKQITAENLKALRLKVKRSQTAFADLLGVSPITISRWETGTTSPKGINIRRALMRLIERYL